MLSKPAHEEVSVIPAGRAYIGPRETGGKARNPDFAIRVSDVSKCYGIYDRPQDRLKQAMLPRFQRIIGNRTPRQYYREFWALRGVSFDVPKGETVGIIGRNGAGKSTLLQIICGTLTPTSGQVEIDGRVAALLELGSGFNSDFTGRENVYLYAGVLGLRREEIDARVDDIAAFADIGEFLDMPLKTYSSGMFLRLAFAVIAHVNADILVVDEALAVGDAFFVQKCMRFLRKFMEKGTILFVSHDTGAVVNLCQRAIWLDGGSIRAAGSPKEISEGYHANLYEAHQGPLQSVKTVSNLGNDMRDVAAPGAAAFGKGGAVIIGVELSDSRAGRLTGCVGGESVTLRVRCKANDDLSGAIIGFLVKDRLGQFLFGDNTYQTCIDRPLNIRGGHKFEAAFTFDMPILPTGDYSICVAIAEGTQAEHVQHHWIHDALFFKSYASGVSTGLVGIPMQKIEMGLA
jgi:lipopolysaccharide transport system ATP-binding protein